MSDFVGGNLSAQLFEELLRLGAAAVLYVLMALGLQTLAKRRGVRHGWMAWVPLLNAWLLAAIADDARSRGLVPPKSYRRSVIIASVAAILCLAILAAVMYFVIMPPILELIPQEKMEALTQQVFYGELTEAELQAELDALTADAAQKIGEKQIEDLLRAMSMVTLVSILAVVSAIIETVYTFLSMFAVFESCEPSRKTLYLLLSIFLGVGGLCLFLCRNKDLGLQKPLLPADQD